MISEIKKEATEIDSCDESHVPNQDTIDALQDSRDKKVIQISSIDHLFEDINS